MLAICLGSNPNQNIGRASAHLNYDSLQSTDRLDCGVLWSEISMSYQGRVGVDSARFSPSENGGSYIHRLMVCNLLQGADNKFSQSGTWSIVSPFNLVKFDYILEAIETRG